MNFTNHFVIIEIIAVIAFIFFAFILLPILNVKNKKTRREWGENHQEMVMGVVMIFFLSFLIIFFTFIVDSTYYGPVKQSTTSSFTISGRDQTVKVTVGDDKKIGNQTFVFDDTFNLITKNKNVDGRLETDLDDNLFTFNTLTNFKENFVNNKDKKKFKLIYKEEKYINETLFQMIKRTLSGSEVKKDKIKTSVTIKITEDSDFDYEQK